MFTVIGFFTFLVGKLDNDVLSANNADPDQIVLWCTLFCSPQHHRLNLKVGNSGSNFTGINVRINVSQ